MLIKSYSDRVLLRAIESLKKKSESQEGGLTDEQKLHAQNLVGEAVRRKLAPWYQPENEVGPSNEEVQPSSPPPVDEVVPQGEQPKQGE